eukprot:CCRYP_021184-RA/>CCRYP_021184-RA protein AED:0.04 eAED:0.04 QI:227/1/1/1/1/1/3/950/373
MDTDDASLLRSELDHLLERFRGETTPVAEVPELVAEIRQALQEEFVEIVSQFSYEALQKAVLMTFDDSRRLPIHLACDKNAPIEILRCFLDADVGKVSIRVPDKWGDLPLHTACSRHQTEVVKLLVDSDVTKKTIHTKADNGSLPLHTAIRYKAPASVVHLLLENNESTLLEPGPYNQLPLHVACRNSATPEVIQLLLQRDTTKKAVIRGDDVGRLPIHLALLHATENQLSITKLLMEGMLCGRMELRGLDLWKADMKHVLELLQTHERDFTTRDKLDIVQDVIRNFIERIFNLELAVWRASCLQFSAEFSSIHCFIEHLSSLELSDTKDTFDASVYKADRRIKSGADVIVRDVMPYLEFEPVNELISKLMDY